MSASGTLAFTGDVNCGFCFNPDINIGAYDYRSGCFGTMDWDGGFGHVSRHIFWFFGCKFTYGDPAIADHLNCPPESPGGGITLGYHNFDDADCATLPTLETSCVLTLVDYTCEPFHMHFFLEFTDLAAIQIFLDPA